MATSAPIHIVTPVLESQALGQLLKKRVFLKLENCQPSGSFKLRGIGNACKKAIENGATHLVTSSGGNAGLAVAYSARKLGVPATCFVPEIIPLYMQERLASEGLKVIVAGKVWAEAHQAAMKFLDQINKTSKAAYIHPFDDPDVVEGHSSIVAELKDQLPSQPDLVIIAVGGGGFFSGVCQGLKQHGWESTRILAMETHGADKLEQSLQRKEKVTLPGINTIAKSLGALAVSDTAFAYSQELRVIGRSVSDEEVFNACVRFMDHKFLVEAACGAALAALYSGRLPEFLGAEYDDVQSICVLVCGGLMTQISNEVQEALRPAFF
ncbi:hypothetical protein LEN26_018642 [Aphanomyces euteiches]|nr:hypothetical protein LEN26_018642 [Aphanomyces euteiches]